MGAKAGPATPTPTPTPAASSIADALDQIISGYDSKAEAAPTTADEMYLFGGHGTTMRPSTVAKLMKDCPRPPYFEDDFTLDTPRFAWDDAMRAKAALFFLGPAGSGVGT